MREFSLNFLTGTRERLIAGHPPVSIPNTEVKSGWTETVASGVCGSRLCKDLAQILLNNAEAHWEPGYAYRFDGMSQESVTWGLFCRALSHSAKMNSSAMNAYLHLGWRLDGASPVSTRAFFRGL